jgi:ATP/maltotriose-dependent transcriptional regulator MalT
LADLETARKYLAEARAIRETIPSPAPSLFEIDLFDWILMDLQGEWERVAEMINVFLSVPTSTSIPFGIERARLILARSLFERGELTVAMTELQAILDSPPVEKEHIFFLALYFQSAMQSYLGNIEQAAHLIVQMENIIQANQSFYTNMFTDWAKAILNTRQGEWEKAENIFSSLLEKTKAHKMRWYHARLTLNWAEMELLARQVKDAGQTRLRLEQARDEFASIPAPGFVRKTEALLANHFYNRKNTNPTA